MLNSCQPIKYLVCARLCVSPYLRGAWPRENGNLVKFPAIQEAVFMVWKQMAWICILALSLTSCLNLGELFNLFMPRFPYIVNERKKEKEEKGEF